MIFGTGTLKTIFRGWFYATHGDTENPFHVGDRVLFWVNSQGAVIKNMDCKVLSSVPVHCIEMDITEKFE